jgi:phage terminase Nu1 subunit (DNA packaging protein)
MLDEEIYLLTKHGKFQADYIENIPVYRRRHFIYLLNKEFDAIEEEQEKMKNKYK